MFVIFRKTLLGSTLTQALANFMLNPKQWEVREFEDVEGHYDKLTNSDINGVDHLKLVQDLATEDKLISGRGNVLTTIGEGSKTIKMVETLVNTPAHHHKIGVVMYEFKTADQLGVSVGLDFYLEGDINTLNSSLRLLPYSNDEDSLHYTLFDPILESNHEFGVITQTLLIHYILTLMGEDTIVSVKTPDREWYESAADYILRNPETTFKFLLDNQELFSPEIYLQHKIDQHIGMPHLQRIDDFNTEVYMSVLCHKQTSGDMYGNVMRSQFAEMLMIKRNAMSNIVSAGEVMKSLALKNGYKI